MKITKTAKTYFFEDKPLFGLDISREELRVMQFDMRPQQPLLLGYGSISFDPAAIKDGIIVKPEIIAAAAKELFAKQLVGEINTTRVAVSLPTNRAFTHAVNFPRIKNKDMESAVQTEAEQYMPGHAEDLYWDYTKIRENAEGIELFVVAMPKDVVGSYIQLTRMMGLEAVLFDTSIGASAHSFATDKQSDVPSLLINVGNKSTDITVFNNGIVATGTAAFGGDTLSLALAMSLGITQEETMALKDKSKYDLYKSTFQKQSSAALEQSLAQLLKEIRRTIRYYEQRYTQERPIAQIITMGGWANVPGLADYLTDHLRLPARTFDPAIHINHSNLPSFHKADHMSFVTAAGLAMTNPLEIFA